MPKNFKISLQTPADVARVVVGALVLLNLIAAYFVVRPPGGSPDQLQIQVRDLTSRIQQNRAVLDRTRLMVNKIQAGRKEGDQFLTQYFLPSGEAYSSVLSELVDLAKQAQLKPKEVSYNLEPIEGSDTLQMMTVSQNYEGTYKELIQFVNALDKSSRLLIVDSMQATPQSTGVLNVTLKLETFVREEGTSE